MYRPQHLLEASRTTISIVPATVKMDTNNMDCEDIKEFPRSTIGLPSWSMVAGRSLNVMNNIVYFDSFPLIDSRWLIDIFKSVKDYTKSSVSTEKAKMFSTFRCYLNTVPRINFVSKKVLSNFKTNCILSSETDSDSDVILDSIGLDFKNPHRDKEVMSECDGPYFEAHSLIYQSISIQNEFECTSSDRVLRTYQCESEDMREIKCMGYMDITGTLDAEDDDEDDDDDDEDYDVTSVQTDQIQTLKIRYNQYIRNDFDLLHSKRMPFFDPYKRKLPKFTKDLSTGLLAELLKGFGMEFKISKYKNKPSRLDSNEIFCKNLFLKDRKGKFYYIICNEDFDLDLKKTTKYLDAYRNLSFASESDTDNLLHVERGGLTPFSLLYDRDCRIKVLITTDLLLETDRLFNFHPFDRNLTLCLNFNDLKMYLAIFNHSLEYLPI